MAEKLYRSRCPVPGHGTRCEVAFDIYPDKKSLSKLRRRLEKKEIRNGQLGVICGTDVLWFYCD